MAKLYFFLHYHPHIEFLMSQLAFYAACLIPNDKNYDIETVEMTPSTGFSSSQFRLLLIFAEC
jgi:hypothetical protein